MKNTLLSILTMAFVFAGCAGSQNQGKMNQDLIVASREGKMPRVVALIRDGADINATDSNGWTPYLAASAEGNWKVMRLLQDMGAKTDPGF